MAQRIAVTRKLPPLGEQMLDELEAGGDYTIARWPGELPPGPEELNALLAGAVGAITLLTEPIDGDLLDHFPDLRVISNYAVGFDNVDVPAATERNVAVCNTPGVLTDATADSPLPCSWPPRGACPKRNSMSATTNGKPGRQRCCSARN